MSETLALVKDLISRQSITPDDAGCQELLIKRLEKFDFSIAELPFGDVQNIWMRHGEQAPLLTFIGHTDVVPTGPLDEWHTNPFEPVVKDGFIYGRGACDMKGGLAAFVTATERFVEKHPEHKGSISLLITSDEEGPSIHGTKKVIEYLTENGIKIDWCLVGEPSSREKLGDIIKNGRRGTLSGKLVIHGVQGHIAYPHKSDNPIHKSLPALNELTTTVWDKGNEFFEPTSFQMSNIHAGTGANNIIPGHLEIDFNFRYSTELTADEIQSRFEKILHSHKLKFEVTWKDGGEPFLTSSGALLTATISAIEEVVGTNPELSTEGGTSDGRFIAPTGAEVIELGPSNKTIHRINECVSIADLDKLSQIYEKILTCLLT